MSDEVPQGRKFVVVIPDSAVPPTQAILELAFRAVLDLIPEVKERLKEQGEQGEEFTPDEALYSVGVSAYLTGVLSGFRAAKPDEEVIH